MTSHCTTMAFAVFSAVSTLLAFVACGSDSAEPADAASTGGLGGVTSTNTATRGGAATTGGAATSVGGRASTSTGGRTTNAGGRSGSTGGTSSAGGQVAVDFNCNEGLECTADCTSACGDQSSNSYTCTCANGQLTCDMSNCFAAPTCATTVADSSACDGNSDSFCSSSDGGTFCFCDQQSSTWTCFEGFGNQGLTGS